MAIRRNACCIVVFRHRATRDVKTESFSAREIFITVTEPSKKNTPDHAVIGGVRPAAEARRTRGPAQTTSSGSSLRENQ